MSTPLARIIVLIACVLFLSSCDALKGKKKCCLETCRSQCCADTWQDLIQEDLSNVTLRPNGWTYAQGVLATVGKKGSVWTKDQYGDFILDFDFKVDPQTNSGVFIRTGDINNSVQTGIEIQIYDSFGKDAVGTHDCGAVYDALAPGKNTVKQAGEWNHMTIKAQGSLLEVIMNDVQIIDMNLHNWDTAQFNPDGTGNKFKMALKDFPRVGNIGFQDHGKKVWYRNIKIKTL
ncbi:MAG: DUF1080 domain-containing protein [Phycisphaeraceae bacterium]|nr:DUF1080 domain-containing protein [Phycisphaeraceae bacterium]